jgi:hypothetical protein
MILDQVDRDDAVRDLLKKLSEVYTFMNEEKRLAEIPTMQTLCGKLARQTLECTDFIIHYSETKSACESNTPHRRHCLTLNVVSLHRGKTSQERVGRN